MKSVYKVLAYAVAVEVIVQAMAIVYAIAGQGKWVDEGGVIDKALVESEQFVFPEILGFIIHGINGSMLIPVTALLLLIFSFFAKFPGAVKWAALVLLLVAVQVNLGFFGHSIPAMGALHGLNALLLFSAAIYTACRGRDVAQDPAVEQQAPLTTPN